MRTMTAREFSGYEGLGEVEASRPVSGGDEVLVRVTAAGVTPLEHTVLFGGIPRAKAPLVLGNEGAGVIADAGVSGLAIGSRVAFTGRYGVTHDGARQDYVLVQSGDLLPVPDGIDDVLAASLPVAYLTAQITLTQAGFAPGKTVLAPGIGGSVGNATYQLAKAQGAAIVISTAGSAAKAAQAQAQGYDNVINLTAESIADGVRRITSGAGVDIVIESLGGSFTGETLGTLALDGTLVSLGYSAGRKASIDVTDLIWRRARMFGFTLGTQGAAVRAEAWNQVLPLVASGKVVPIVERTYPLAQAVEAMRHLHEGRPLGKLVLAL